MKRLLIAFALTSLAGLANVPASADVPSCVTFAKAQTTAGASPACAPAEIANEMAFRVLDDPALHKVGHDYHLVPPAGAWGLVPMEMRWFALAMMVSAVQSLHGANADVIVRLEAANRAEQVALMMGDVPDRLLLARARYDWPGTMEADQAAFPPGHHPRLYVLIVYDRP